MKETLPGAQTLVVVTMYGARDYHETETPGQRVLLEMKGLKPAVEMTAE